MPSLKRLLIVCLLMAAYSISLAAPLKIGASYQDAITSLGEPDGELDAGSRKILTYGTAQIKLKDGEVNR